jgi:hypothetical protein
MWLRQARGSLPGRVLRMNASAKTPATDPHSRMEDADHRSPASLPRTLAKAATRHSVIDNGIKKAGHTL